LDPIRTPAMMSRMISHRTILRVVIEPSFSPIKKKYTGTTDIMAVKYHRIVKSVICDD